MFRPPISASASFSTRADLARRTRGHRVRGGALSSLDTIVLRSSFTKHRINRTPLTETTAGNLQNLIRWTRVVFNKDFLSAG